MKHRYHKISHFLVFLAFLTVIVVLMLWKANRTLRQQTLDRQLIACVESNQADQVTHLLHEGADANARKPAFPPMSLGEVLLNLLQGRHTFPAGDSALMIAVGRVYAADVSSARPDNAPVVKALLEAHADPNVLSSYGETPLLEALVRDKGREVPLLLIRHGADPNRPNKDGRTALMSTNDTALLTAFLEGGGQIDGQDHEGDTVLIRQTAFRDDATAMALLLAHGATPEEKNYRGYTVLRQAAFAGRRKMVKFLIGYGADVNARDTAGETILRSLHSVAVDPKVIALLKASGAKE